jgi:hypothetical protein
MDRTIKYREIIQELMTGYANVGRPENGVEDELILALSDFK